MSEKSAEFLEEELKKKLGLVKLEKIGDNSLTFHVAGPILHEINMKPPQVIHLIQTNYDKSWAISLDELELLTQYLKFIRALCKVTRFPSEKTKAMTIFLAKMGKTHVVELCKRLYGKEWNEVLWWFER